MSSKTASLSLADAAKALVDLLGESARLGRGLLGSVELPIRHPQRRCEVPPPCWAPQPIGAITDRACPGEQAVVGLNITNCGAADRTIQVETTNPAVTVDPPSLTLGGMQQGLVMLSLGIPASVSEGEVYKAIVWVRGCQDHFLRWTVTVARRSLGCRTDVDVEDCPDLVHHWYDHFYCERPCVHRG